MTVPGDHSLSDMSHKSQSKQYWSLRRFEQNDFLDCQGSSSIKGTRKYSEGLFEGARISPTSEHAGGYWTSSGTLVPSNPLKASPFHLYALSLFIKASLHTPEKIQKHYSSLVTPSVWLSRITWRMKQHPRYHGQNIPGFSPMLMTILIGRE